VFLINAVVLIALAASAMLFVMRRVQENAGASASLASAGPSVEQKTEEQNLARPAANPSQVSSVPAGAERKKVVDLERASWDAAFAKYREQIALYDFAGASATIENVQLSEVSLKQAQELTKRKVGWLLDWKNRLIADLNKEQFSGSFRDINGTSYIGIREGTPERLFLRTARRTVELPWTKLQPRVLLAISASFIRLNAPGAVDRQWRCAVFASEFGQMELAREFAEAAAKGKQQYREEMSQLFSVAH
jgi:hypothetical protein